MNCTFCDSRTMSWAPFLIALSSSGNRNESVSRESSVHSMMSISSPLMKSIKPMTTSENPKHYRVGCVSRQDRAQELRSLLDCMGFSWPAQKMPETVERGAQEPLTAEHAEHA